jgi:hypothetical protein
MQTKKNASRATTQGNPYLISTEEFFSFAGAAGAAAAGHAAAPLWHHPWLENTRKVVHKAAEGHHMRFLKSRSIQLEEELRQVREQLRRRGVTIPTIILK